MRTILCLIGVAFMSVAASAQCPGGRCPTAGYGFSQQFYPQANVSRFNQIQVVAPVRSRTVVRQRTVEQVPAALVAPVTIAMPPALIQPVASCPCNGACNCNNMQNCGCNYNQLQQVPTNVTASISVHTLNPGGPIWNYYGNDLAGHLAQAHGVDPTGMTQQQMVIAHSRAHNTGQVTTVGRTGPVRRLLGY